MAICAPIQVTATRKPPGRATCRASSIDLIRAVPTAACRTSPDFSLKRVKNRSSPPIPCADPEAGHGVGRELGGLAERGALGALATLERLDQRGDRERGERDADDDDGSEQGETNTMTIATAT